MNAGTSTEKRLGFDVGRKHSAVRAQPLARKAAAGTRYSAFGKSNSKSRTRISRIERIGQISFGLFAKCWWFIREIRQARVLALVSLLVLDLFLDTDGTGRR
jgi:hypothetical protein